MQRNEEKAKQLFNDLIEKKTDHSVREALYVFLGFNSRYIEFNRKLVFDEYFKVVEKVYEHGQFYFKYFNWYMTPTALTLEECLELEKGFKALLERVDPLKTQLHNAAQNHLSSIKQKIKIFKKVEEDISTVRNFVSNQKRKHLTQRMAEVRSSRVNKDSVVYHVELKLDLGKDFSGNSNMEFQTQSDGGDLFLDHELAEITALQLNDYKYTQEDLKRYVKIKFIFLPKEHMNYGEQNKNNVVISFKGKYWNDGTGIHSSVEGEGENVK